MDKKTKRKEAIKQYRELSKTVKDLPKKDPSKVLAALKDDLIRTKELYPIVKRRIDGTLIDARHSKEVAALGRETANRITLTTQPFTMRGELRRMMRNRLPGESLYQIIAEQFVPLFLRRAPDFDFRYGRLNEQDPIIKTRKKREPREIVDTQATTAKQAVIDDSSEQDQTPKEVEHIQREVERLARRTNGELSYYRTIIDPSSFSQTLENIFHVSFLVKEGKFGLKKDAGGDLILTVHEKSDLKSSKRNNQSIFSFSPQDYKRWIRDCEITERAFPALD